MQSQLPARGFRFKGDTAAHDEGSPNANERYAPKNEQKGDGLKDAVNYCTKKSKQVAKDLASVALGKKSASALNKYSSKEIKDGMACQRFEEANKSAQSSFQKGKGFVSDFLNFGPSTNADSPFTRMVGLPTGTFSNSEMEQLLPVVKRLNPQAGNVLAMLLRGKKLSEQKSGVSSKELFSLLKDARGLAMSGRGKQMPNPRKYGKDDHIEYSTPGQGPATSYASPRF